MPKVRDLGKALDEDFSESLRWLADNCEFNSLARIALVSQWLFHEYRSLADRLGVPADDDDDDELDKHFWDIRAGDFSLHRDLDAFYQLGFDPPNNVAERAAQHPWYTADNKLDAPVSRWSEAS